MTLHLLEDSNLYVLFHTNRPTLFTSSIPPHSLGILFFELFFSISSSASGNREVVLRELRQRVLPPSFLKHQVSNNMKFYMKCCIAA